MQIITNAHRFAEFFNTKVPGAYRRITARDILDMKSCGLIGHSNYYGHADLEIIRGILEYEQMREKHSAKQTSEYTQEPLKCKMCGEPLPNGPEGKRGRRRQYCTGCESSRSTERKKKSRRQGSKRYKPAIT